MWCDAFREDTTLWLGAIGCLALLIGPFVLLARGKGVRGPLAFTWAVTSVFAPVGWFLLGAAWWPVIAVAAGAGFGLLVAAVERGRRRAAFGLMGALGGAGWFSVLLILLAGASGSCLD